MKSRNDQLKEEFQLFLSTEEIRPPHELSLQIQQHISRDLNPPFFNTFMKVLGVHAAVSLVSLSLCSQFGFRTLPLFDLMNQFMKVVGSTYCMVFCGAIYLGLSALALSLLLRPTEIAAIRKHVVLQITLLTGISLGVFLCLGAEILLVPAALWIAGSLAGGIITFEAGWLLRSQFRKKLIYGL